MTLTTATQLTSRAQVARRASIGVFGSPLAAAAAICHPQRQVRGFRFGRLWSSYFDPEFSRNGCRRQRHSRYKYAETSSRRLSWDQNSVASGDAKPVLKRVLRGYWDPSGVVADDTDGAKSATTGAAQTTPDNPEGIRPGQNIEDAERAPLEDLLFGHHHEQQTSWPGREHQRRSSKSARNGRTHQFGSTNTEPDADYIIDPITNRKVLKAKRADASSRSFKSYRSQFAQFTPPDVSNVQAPIFYDGPPPESELEKYDQVRLDARPWDTVNRGTIGVGAVPSGSQLDDSKSGSGLLNAIAWSHQEVFWHHKDGATCAKVWDSGPDTSEYTDLHKYRPVLDEQPVPPDQQSATQYEDLERYSAVKYQEPDGLPRVQEPTHTYGDLDSYMAIYSHEPDGKYKAQAESEVTEHQELDKYEAVRSHEPDAKYRAAEDDNNQQYKDLDRYGPIKTHEPDGKYKERAEVPGQQYADLDQYGSVQSHEPDGKYKAEQDSWVPQYEDLGEYGPVRACEPDGKYKAEDDAAVQQYDDLHKYGAVRAHEPDGKYKAQADASVASEIDPEELKKYKAFRSHEPDGLYAASYVKPSPDAEELAQYKPFRSHEPDGKYAASYKNPSEDRIEETRYQAFRSHEPDGKYSPSSQVDPSMEYTDLQSYGPFRSHEPDGKYAPEQSKSAKQTQELGQYQAVRSHEPDGKYSAQSESCTEVPDLGNHEAFGYEDSETNIPLPGHEIGADLKEYKTVHHNELDGQTVSHLDGQNPGAAIASEESVPKPADTTEEYATDKIISREGSESQLAASPDTEKFEYRKLQELLMSDTAAEDPTGICTGSPKLHSADEIPASSKVLTGNYVKDFPEEFSQSWGPTNPGQDSSLLPSNWRLPVEEKTETSKSEIPNGVARSPAALESALDRYQKPGRGRAVRRPSVVDPYSKEPQGLETSYVEECGKDVPVFATIYGPPHPGSKSPPSASLPEAKPTSEDVPPTLYKVLVYDPQSQSVEIGETTSIVPDTSNPLTPAEVLLRISNPSKFVPHLAPLQAQGYEIVSGSGDVLVFRKVREAAARATDQSDLPPETGPNGGPSTIASSLPPINPIDMTGGGFRDIDVAASRFASPTGFVNYDLPPIHYKPTASPPSSRGAENGSGVYHERPTSHPPNVEMFGQGSRKGSKSLSKQLLLGAVWVGGLSYSLAVVGDYFKTGGTDGKGTRGRL